MWKNTPACILTTTAMLLACTAAAFAAVNGMYVCSALCAAAAFGAACVSYRLMTRSSRIAADFIRSVRNSDFQGFPDKGGCIPGELVREMEDALGHFRTSLQDKESRLQYFQALVNHIDTAVIVYTEHGTVEWMNSAAMRLTTSADDKSILSSLRPGTLKVLQVRQKDELTQYAVSSTWLTLHGRRLTVVSLKNIHSALDSQETLAWQKLIRVLTHEIMNSITPIVSLTEILNRQIASLGGSEQDKEDIRQMLATIARRSDALTRFVSGYREVSHLPQPVLQSVDTAGLTRDIAAFVGNAGGDISVTVPPARLTVIADKGQIEQVLINLIRNAREHGASRICLSSGVSPAGKTFIRVSDNGTGIEPEVQERIFIPFFTTKQGGSGIGLALARQIMLQHNGNILVRSVPGEGSEFTLVFQ